jgi:hypothetical protein
MASDDNIIDITKLLFVLKKEEELIIKPFHSSKIIYKIQIYYLKYLFLLYKKQYMRLTL